MRTVYSRGSLELMASNEIWGNPERRFSVILDVIEDFLGNKADIII